MAPNVGPRADSKPPNIQTLSSRGVCAHCPGLLCTAVPPRCLLCRMAEFSLQDCLPGFSSSRDQRPLMRFRRLEVRGQAVALLPPGPHPLLGPRQPPVCVPVWSLLSMAHTSPVGLGPTLMMSFDLNYLLKGPSLTMGTSRGRPPQAIWGNTARSTRVSTVLWRLLLQASCTETHLWPRSLSLR